MPPPPSSTNFNLHGLFRSLGVPTLDRIVSVLGADFPGATQPDGDAMYQRRRTERIAQRAWAARAAGSERKTPRLVALLEAQLRHRSLHHDWRYHGLDGVMAAQSLARLRATESVPVLIGAFRRVDPDLQKIAAPQWGEYPLAWRDSRFKMALLPALGELDCPASRRFLLERVVLLYLHYVDTSHITEWLGRKSGRFRIPSLAPFYFPQYQPPTKVVSFAKVFS